VWSACVLGFSGGFVIGFVSQVSSASFKSATCFVYLSDKPEEVQRFVYITNIEQTSKIVTSTADSGRLRWEIENEGFNN